ncbi:MAG: DPP IV N-terminal domain-containing protein [Pyrinomonadaceae bacterium]
MKKLSLVIAATFAFAVLGTAQDKMLTIDEIFSADPKVRVPFSGTPVQLRWAADGTSFKQVQAGKLMRVNALTGEATPYLDTTKLIAALARVGLKADIAERLANSPGLQFNKDETAILLTHDAELWLFDIAAGTLKRLTKNDEDEMEADFSPDGKWISFVRGNDLYVVDAERGGEKQLTRDGGEKIFNGYLDWVYEEELYGRGQKRGYWWSPDSTHIAFLRLDESPVPRWVLTNDIPDDQIVQNTDYPQAGDPNPLVRLGIADVTRTSRVPNVGRIQRVSGMLRLGGLAKFVDLKNYEPEDLLIARVAWSPDSKAVVFQALNREQTFLDVNAATLAGKVTKLFTEDSPAWVEVYGNPEFLSDGTAVWQSSRNGWTHLYHYGNDGKLIKQLTDGKWEVRSVYGVDEANGWIYFSATKDNHIAENVYRVKLSGGEPERLTKGEGSHSASFNSTFTHYVQHWSDASTPSQQKLFRSDGTLERVLNENKVTALTQYNLGSPEFLKVKTRDGFEMEAMMIRPPNFDPNKKYPVLSYTYAGPHAPSVRDGWGGSRYMWHQMMAQKGYIIWICDNRTASGKGQESVWPVYKNFGPLELRDLEDGVNYLKSLTFVDGERIGIWGWSYGGFMTSYAMTHSRSFKAGIAGGSVTDWRLYDSIYTERYMLMPQNNKAGYDRTSVSRAAKDLHGRLMLIHGVMDDNVHMQNTMQLAHELQKAGKQFDLMVYPTQQHGISDRDLTKHWYQMMTDFVLKNL